MLLEVLLPDGSLYFGIGAREGIEDRSYTKNGIGKEHSGRVQRIAHPYDYPVHFFDLRKEVIRSLYRSLDLFDRAGMRIVEKSRVLASGNVADKFRVSHRELKLAASVRDLLPNTLKAFHPLLRFLLQMDALLSDPVIELSSGSGCPQNFMRRLVFAEDDLAVQNIDGHAFGAPQ